MPSEESPDPDEEKGIRKKEIGKGESGTSMRKKEKELEDGGQGNEARRLYERRERREKKVSTKERKKIYGN